MNWEQVVKDNLLYTCVVGSRSRGLAMPDSDYDYRRVYMPPVKFNWLLEGTPPDQLHFEGDDIAYHVLYFIRSLYKPSPETIEMLWVDDEFVLECGVKMNILPSIRHKFTSKAVVQKLVAAAGFVAPEAVLRYMQTGDTSEIGTKHLLGRAIKYRDDDPAEANKALCDTLRRLLVAREMLKTYQPKTEDDAPALWNSIFRQQGLNVPDLYDDNSGKFLADYSDEWTATLRGVKMGRDDWDMALSIRNQLYIDIQSSLETSALRDKADPIWGQAYLGFIHRLA